MNFTRKIAIRMDLSKSKRWSPLFGIPELCKMFSDGRLFGKIAEHVLALEFDNLRLAPEGGSFDLETDGQEVIEVKSITKYGFETSPSSMLGSGRVYNAEDHITRINSIAERNGYYIFADNRQLPIVTFYPVAANENLVFTNRNGIEVGCRTSNQADAFLATLLCATLENESQLTIIEI